MTKISHERAMTVHDASACLGLSPTEIRHRIRRHDIDALNVGGHRTGTRYRVTETALTAYIRTLAA